MEFWVITAVLVAAALAYEVFAARRALRVARENADAPLLRRDISWVIFVAAFLGSSFGRSVDLGFAMAMIVVVADTVFGFLAAAHVYDYRANWRRLEATTLARTAIDFIRWGFAESVFILGLIAVGRAVLDRLQEIAPSL